MSSKELLTDLKSSLKSALPQLQKEIDSICDSQKSLEPENLSRISRLIKGRIELIKKLLEAEYSIGCLLALKDLDDLISDNSELAHFFENCPEENRAAAQKLKRALAVEGLAPLLNSLQIKQEQEGVYQLVLKEKQTSFYHQLDLPSEHLRTLADCLENPQNGQEQQQFALAFYMGLIYWFSAQKIDAQQKLVVSLDKEAADQLGKIEKDLRVDLTVDNYRQILGMLAQAGEVRETDEGLFRSLSKGAYKLVTAAASYYYGAPSPRELLDVIPKTHEKIQAQKKAKELKTSGTLSEKRTQEKRARLEEERETDKDWIGMRANTRLLLTQTKQDINSYEPLFKELTFNLYKNEQSEELIQKAESALQGIDQEGQFLFKTCLVLALRAQEHHSQLLAERLTEVPSSDNFEKLLSEFFKKQGSPYIEILNEYLADFQEKQKQPQLLSLLTREIYQAPLAEAYNILEGNRAATQKTIKSIEKNIALEGLLEASREAFRKQLPELKKINESADQKQRSFLKMFSSMRGITQPEKQELLLEVREFFSERGYPYMNELILLLTSLKRDKLEGFLTLLQNLSSNQIPRLEEDRAWMAFRQEMKQVEKGEELFQALTVYFVKAWSKKFEEEKSPIRSQTILLAEPRKDSLKNAYTNALNYRISWVHALLYVKAEYVKSDWKEYVKGSSPYYKLCKECKELNVLLETALNSKQSEQITSGEVYSGLTKEICSALSDLSSPPLFNGLVDELKSLPSWQKQLPGLLKEHLNPSLLLLKKEHKEKAESLKGQSFEELKGSLITPFDLRGYDRELALVLFRAAEEKLTDQKLKNYIKEELLPHLETEIVEVNEGDEKAYKFLGGGVLNQVFMLSYKDAKRQEIKGVYKPDPSAHSLGIKAREWLFGTAQLAGISGGLEGHLPYRAVFSSVVDELLYGKKERASVETRFVSCNGKRGILMSLASGGAPQIAEGDRISCKISLKASFGKEATEAKDQIDKDDFEDDFILVEKKESLSKRIEELSSPSKREIIEKILESGYELRQKKKLIAFFVGCRRVEIKKNSKGYLISYKPLTLSLGKKDPFDYKKPETLEGLIKLQIKDWITGECDRHPENYYIDTDGKVTGIDEDCCGGILSVPQDKKGELTDVRNQFNALVPNNGSLMLRMPGVVTAKVKKSIDDLYEKREELKKESRPYLSEEEIEMMVWRLQKLKEHVATPESCLVVKSAEELLSDEAILAMNTNNSYLMRELHTFKKQRFFQDGEWKWEKCGWNHLRKARNDDTGV